MPTTLFSDESLSFLPQQWAPQQIHQIYTIPTGTATSSSDSSSSSEGSIYNEGSNSPVRSPDTTTPNDTNGGPYLQVLKQPHDKFRFRYKTEMQGTHGAILAFNNGQRVKKEYPKVKLCNYTPDKNGNDPIIRCTLYSADGDEDKRVVHVHRLMGKGANGAERDDPHDFTVHGPEYTAELKQLTILFTKKEDQEIVMMQKQYVHAWRKMTKNAHVAPPPLKVNEQLRSRAHEELANLNLNVACLRFEALIDKGHGLYVPICKPVYSIPINNMKNPQTNELRICRVSKCSGSCLGGEEMFMFVEKVVKKNIKVRFFELGQHGEVIWEDYGAFSQDDVHHQYGIALKTPCYRDPNITNSVEVFFQLERPSDKAVSDKMTFEYRPNPNRLRDLNRKRPRQESFSATLPEVLTEYPQRPQQTLSQEVTSSSLEELVTQLFTTDQANEDFLKLYENDNFNEMETGEPMSSVRSSSDVSLTKLLDKLPSADAEALCQFWNSGRIEDYIHANGDEFLMGNEGQAAGFANDLVLDGLCRAPLFSKPSSDQRYQATFQMETRDPPLPVIHSQMQTKETPTTVPLRASIRTSAKLLLNETNIVEKTLIALNNLVKFKKIKKMKEKLFQKCLIHLFSLSVEESEDSVLHVIATSNETPVPLQATNIINRLKVFNVIDRLINIRNNKNETPLLVAAARGTPYMVTQFLEAGADVNTSDIRGNTALHLAVLRDTSNLEIVDALLASYPALTKYNEDGYTPLHLAVSRRKSDLVSALLIKTEDDVSREDTEDDVSRGYSDAEEQINKQDRKRGNTALHIAVENRFKEVVKLLLNFDEKIEIDATNFDGKTALAFVLREKDPVAKEIAELLLDNEADPTMVVCEPRNNEECNFEMEPDLDIYDVVESLDEVSAYAREWGDNNGLFDKATITKLCQLLDKRDNWIKLLKRLKYSHSEIDYCKIHWSPTLSAFKIAELNKPEVTAEVIRDELMIMGPHLRCGAKYIDDMFLKRLGVE